MIVLVAGGDERMTCLAGLLTKSGEKVYLLAGDPQRETPQKAKPLDYLFWLKEQPDVIFLPIPYSRDGVTLFQKAGREEIRLSHLLDLCSSRTIIFGGMLDCGFLEECEKRGIQAFDYSKTQSFLDENCRLTAQGTLKALADQGIKGVSEAKTLIVGYGGCGKALTKLFLSQGGMVTVVARREASRQEASDAGADTACFEELENLAPQLDLVINTVPAIVLKKGFLSLLSPHCCFVELVAPPGGSEIEALSQRDFDYLYAPSLPGRFFPEESAKAILFSVEEITNERR